MKKINKSLLFAIAQIFLIFYLFFYFFNFKNPYNLSIFDENLENQIKKELSQLQSNYYISWIIYNQKTKNYYFKNVFGCDFNKNAESCVWSIKDSQMNIFYSEEHRIDDETFNFLDSLQNGQSMFYNDLNNIKKFKTINYLIDNVKTPIKTVGFSVMKNYKSDIVYIFIVMNGPEFDIESKFKIEKTLKNLSNYAWENF